MTNEAVPVTTARECGCPPQVIRCVHFDGHRIVMVPRGKEIKGSQLVYRGRQDADAEEAWLRAEAELLGRND